MTTTNPPQAADRSTFTKGSTARRLVARWTRLVLIALATAYLGVIAVLFVMQEALIFPGKQFQGQPGTALRPTRGAESITLKTPDGERVAAVFGPALSTDGQPVDDSPHRPTLLYFYGNGEHLGGAGRKLESLRRRGLNVMMVDYLGFGQSDGNAGEKGCKDAATIAYDHLLSRTDIDPKRILIGGFSLGGAVAIDLASRKPCVGLLVCCSFTSLPDMAWRNYPMLAYPFLLRHRFPSREAIARVKVPTLISRGMLDPIIPGSMADSLARAAGGPVSRIDMNSAGHDDIAWVAEEDRDVAAAFERLLSQFR